MRLGWFLRSRSLFDTKSILARAIEVCRNPEACFWFRLWCQNNGALNCSSRSNVVVLLNCGSQVNTCVSYANLRLSLSLSLSLFLSSSLCLFVSYLFRVGHSTDKCSLLQENLLGSWIHIFVFVYHCNSRICRIHFIFVYIVRSILSFRTKVKCVLKVQIESAVEQWTRSTEKNLLRVPFPFRLDAYQFAPLVIVRFHEPCGLCVEREI